MAQTLKFNQRKPCLSSTLFSTYFQIHWSDPSRTKQRESAVLSNASKFPKEHCFLESSLQALNKDEYGALVQWIRQGKPEVFGEPLSSLRRPAQMLTWTDRGSNPGLRGKRLATNRLSHCTAFYDRFVLLQLCRNTKIIHLSCGAVNSRRHTSTFKGPGVA